MPTIAFSSFKGGVGKSTRAVSAANPLASSGADVALMAAGAQGTVTAWAKSERLPCTVKSMPLSGPVRRWVDRFLAIEADFIVMDLAPMLGDATAVVLAISDLAVIPVSPSRRRPEGHGARGRDDRRGPGGSGRGKAPGRSCTSGGRR